MQLTPTIAIHLSAALTALVIGPVVLWARLGSKVRPRWHRALGYAWTTCMVATAVSAVFIRSFDLPNVWGYTPIHLLVLLTAFSLYKAFMALTQRDFNQHRRYMQRLYVSACLIAGAFTLLPGRYLGNLIWGEWLDMRFNTSASVQRDAQGRLQLRLRDCAELLPISRLYAHRFKSM